MINKKEWSWKNTLTEHGKQSNDSKRKEYDKVINAYSDSAEKKCYVFLY